MDPFRPNWLHMSPLRSIWTGNLPNRLHKGPGRRDKELDQGTREQASKRVAEPNRANSPIKFELVVSPNLANFLQPALTCNLPCAARTGLGLG